MSYEKQCFHAGEILSAAQLNHIEEGISQLEKNTQQKLGDIKTELEDTKKYVGDKKEKLAAAVTDKGVETASDADFDTIVNNISQIETGGGGFDTIVASVPGYIISTSEINTSIYIEEVAATDDN